MVSISYADSVSLNNIDKMSALMFADDLILISTTREGLYLDILDTYAKNGN